MCAVLIFVSYEDKFYLLFFFVIVVGPVLQFVQLSVSQDIFSDPANYYVIPGLFLFNKQEYHIFRQGIYNRIVQPFRKRRRTSAGWHTMMCAITHMIGTYNNIAHSRCRDTHALHM